VKCTLCGVEAAVTCNDGVCRECHRTESLEDCVANKQVNAIRASRALPAFEPMAPCSQCGRRGYHLASCPGDST
jgi:ribosomal protein S14